MVCALVSVIGNFCLIGMGTQAASTNFNFNIGFTIAIDIDANTKEPVLQLRRSQDKEI